MSNVKQTKKKKNSNVSAMNIFYLSTVQSQYLFYFKLFINILKNEDSRPNVLLFPL